MFSQSHLLKRFLSQFIANLAATVDSNHQQSAAKTNKTPEFNLINKLHICHPFFHLLLRSHVFRRHWRTAGNIFHVRPACRGLQNARKSHIRTNALKLRLYSIYSGWLSCRLRSAGRSACAGLHVRAKINWLKCCAELLLCRHSLFARRHFSATVHYTLANSC